MANRRLHNKLILFYFEAKSFVKRAGFEKEWGWQTSLDFNNFSETDLLRESSWVILCSGFKETIVRRMFSYISLCFCDWQSAEEIVSNKNICRETALSRIGNNKKINAIIEIAQIIYNSGFENLKKRIIKCPLEELTKFPYIGEITVLHLAKNLGLSVAKPDRHLVRLSQKIGFNNVQSLCNEISQLTGDPVPLVDLVLWRFSTLSIKGHQCFKV